MSAVNIIREFLKRQRKYASFFEWFDKGQKELGIVETLLQSVAFKGAETFLNLSISLKDPPDCIAEDQSGNLIGFEVRELVDEEAVRLNAQGKEVYRNWEVNEVIKELESIIVEKDSKTFHGGPYKRLILVIHTDEFVLDFQTLKPFLEICEFKKTNQISEVYLLFSYDPEISHFPHIQLKIAAK